MEVLTVTSKHKHKALTLKEKIKVIEEHEQNRCSPKQIAELFQVGKTQIYEILKNKTRIKAEWLSGRAEYVKRISKSKVYDDVNCAVFEWFLKERANGIPISGPSLQKEALEIAKKLGKPNFKASNGWLNSFKHRHNVYFKPTGEANETSLRTLQNRRDQLECTLGNLWAISDLQKLRNLTFNNALEDTINIEHKLEVTADTPSTPNVVEVSNEIIEAAVFENEDEGQEGEHKVCSFHEALSAVSDLQLFAAHKNIPKLLEKLQDVKEIIHQSIMKALQENLIEDSETRTVINMNIESSVRQD